MSPADSVILLFVDGVGVGSRDPATNPFARLDGTLLGRFQDEAPGVREVHHQPRSGSGECSVPQVAQAPLSLPHGGFWKPIDATLGVAGLPQSATGQATILTGVNAPRRVGRHVSAIPNRRVRELLEEDNLFRILVRAGRRATFANAFTPAFFERKRPHVSATTRSLVAAGIPLRRLDDLLEGRALFHDYSNELLGGRAERATPTEPPGNDAANLDVGMGNIADRDSSTKIPLPRRSAKDAAEILFALARDNDFVLHEHFLTDLAGHRGTEEERVEAARRIEQLVEQLALGASRHGTLVLVVSDHGNLEDLSTRTHTFNPVPFLAWGPGADEATVRARDLTDVTPAILTHLGLPQGSCKLSWS